MITPDQEAFLCEKLRELTESCAQALATMHEEQITDSTHFQNVMAINHALWSLRWEIGLSPGDTTAGFPGVLQAEAPPSGGAL